MKDNELNIVSNIFGGLLTFFIWLKSDASIYTFLTFLIIYGLITFALGVLLAKTKIFKKKYENDNLEIKDF